MYCKADIVCDDTGSTEAEACPEGYICEEASKSEESVYFPCREVKPAKGPRLPQICGIRFMYVRALKAQEHADSGDV